MAITPATKAFRGLNPLIGEPSGIDLPAGRSIPDGSPMSGLSPRNAFVAGVIAILALVPVYAEASGNRFIMSLFTRIVILAIAAVSLNLIMGFGGMVSFGHAVY